MPMCRLLRTGSTLCRVQPRETAFLHGRHDAWADRAEGLGAARPGSQPTGIDVAGIRHVRDVHEIAAQNLLCRDFVWKQRGPGSPRGRRSR